MAAPSSKRNVVKNIDHVLFVPAANDYTDEDAIRIFQQQPIDRVPRYLVPRKNSPVFPPLLHYGWILDLDLTLKLALELYHPFYNYIGGPKKLDYWSTFSGLIRPLMTHLGLPYDERVTVCQIGNGNLTPAGKVSVTLGLSMGTNYTGRIEEESAKKLRDATAPGAELKWFLDAERWQWKENRRVRPRELVNEPVKDPKQYSSTGTQT